MELEGKVALVTGAGSGIGKSTAKLFAQEGARVAVLSRTAEEIEQTAQEIRDAGGEAIAFTADISKPEDIQEVAKAVDQRWGQLDIVFAHAGVNGLWAPIDEIEPEDWEKTVSINLNGTFYTLRYTVPLLKRQGGAIIITSSINGNRKFTSWGSTAYSSTKAAQVAMTKMLALELAEHKIRVNAVCPGAIETQIEENTEKQDIEKAAVPVEYPEGNVPLKDGDPGRPEEVAQLVLFLASSRSSHISGTDVYIDGAEALLEG